MEARGAFYSTRGFYAIEVQIHPDRPEFHNGLVKPRYLTTVYDGTDRLRAPLGAFEHRILFGGDQGQEENTETTTESDGHSTVEDTQSQANTNVAIPVLVLQGMVCLYGNLCVS